MARELQDAVVSLAISVLRARVSETPAWLLRPGKIECSRLWPVVQQIYAELQHQELPEFAPPREWRHVDAVLTTPAGETFILEFDETQHFNHYRRTTLERYPAGAATRFDHLAWIGRCDAKRRLRGGRWGEPKPPLFTGENGRHRQRAFRDALADLLPPLHGLGPTLRIAYFEVEDWIDSPDARKLMAQLLLARGVPT